MSAQLFSCPNPTLQFYPNRLLFSSQFTKSRILVKSSAWWASRLVESRYSAAETEQTLYELLGIAEKGSCTFSDIKKAYRRMARKHHPDMSPPDRVDESTRRFILVQQAYETLSDPVARASYDRALLGSDFDSFSAAQNRKSRRGMEDNGEWKIRWESQLEELKRRGRCNRDRDSSWGARMRARWSGVSSSCR